MRRTKEDAEKTRQTVLEAALKLFSRDGYSLTTLSRIAKEAGCSRGPIYWHFENKDDLYEAVLSYSQEPLEALVAECVEMLDTPVEAMDRFIEQWLWLLATNRQYRQSFEILLNKTELTDAMTRTLKRERALTKSIIGLFQTLVERAIEERLITTQEDPKDLGLLSYTYLMGITQTWLFSPKLFSLKNEMPFFQRQFWALLGKK
ncbi:MAG: TetR family transcriptional regulator [Marinobacter sp.]|uniref:TetR family transcriptional regulator n=1 Tax=Marinobacter sp. TaxID=50741 RepID=UPI001B723835|nr:TetR family transcriptional regulator [Marinobacter sp.]MBQ0745905.1 TetR family transcriptional regulator [Marinobacter sp.]MBQ0813910.1 TetR family transcriptional regulator [Marinobacter sp.]|tara:strand:- start:10566 stop:11177 length:612 start_codon:yes stop_codon:yes gene_type:complete